MSRPRNRRAVLGANARTVFAALLGLFLSTPALAEATANAGRISMMCDAAAHQVSRESGVPLPVLMAISLTETGRKTEGSVRPWPWTVNMEGKGVWFDSQDAAQTYVDRHFDRGARSFDVGCFQINYRWHGQAFSSIEEMFEPVANARYAARFLSELYAEFGDWSLAAGAYHSRTPRYANRYRAKFDQFHAALETASQESFAALDPAPTPPQPVAPQPRVNLFPLLQQKRGARGLGSLVPLGRSPATGLRMIGGERRG